MKPNSQQSNDGLTLELIKSVLKDFADIRMFSVEKGEETPRMAALMYQRFALGVVRAAAACGHGNLASEVNPYSHELQEDIDPEFRESAAARQRAGCMDYGLTKSAVPPLNNRRTVSAPIQKYAKRKE